jgi:hypothetical protein
MKEILRNKNNFMLLCFYLISLQHKLDFWLILLFLKLTKHSEI